MTVNNIEVLREGDASGNGMIFRVIASGGMEIFGLATKNFYEGNWDLGPTWNYLVMADEPFLVDTGRTGTSIELLEMIQHTGFDIKSLKTVVLSHGHEDHDGGLADIVQMSGAGIKAHPIYERFIKLIPDQVPDGICKEFPPSCWHCPMPVSFTEKHCLEYHQARHGLIIENIFDQNNSLGDNIEIMYLPGHSPDAIAIIIDSAIAIVGDNVLARISPAPSTLASFHLVGGIFSGSKPKIKQAFGLSSYIRSLKTLELLGNDHPDIFTLPAHRLYYDDKWNDFSLQDRSREIIDHHIQRCRALLKIINSEPRTVEEVMKAHFRPSLLEGIGSFLAKNEIKSHLELLVASSDIKQLDDLLYIGTGNCHFESYIQSLSPWQKNHWNIEM